jgi:hypothetical protein
VKPYLKANKNDFNDAAAIAEAGGRASMRCVPLKTIEQLELQALHRVRRRFVIERTAVVNQMRALLLEHGIVILSGVRSSHVGCPRFLKRQSIDYPLGSSPYSIGCANAGSPSTSRSTRPRVI